MHYPIHLNLEKLEVVIIGGGSIAYRKCQFFLEINKKVTVVTKEISCEFKGIQNQLTLILDAYKEDYLKDAFIVIAATNDPMLNQNIAQYCLKHQKLVNVVDDAKLSNFIIPATLKRGDLLFSVATGGNSPSLAAKIKKELAITYDETYERYVFLLGQGRQHILTTVADPLVKKQKLNQLINLSLEELEALYDDTPHCQS